ncbi:unnamed protein product [Discula destructiva]
MQFAARYSLMALATVAFVNQSQAGHLLVDNQSDIPIYCYSSRSGDYPTKPSAPPYDKVAPGDNYYGAYAGKDDNVGVAVHCSDEPYVPGNNEYLLQLTVKDGVSYSDISPVNGDPFLRYQRALEFDDSDCPVYKCPPGDSQECEWPISLVCDTEEDLYMSIGGKH